MNDQVVTQAMIRRLIIMRHAKSDWTTGAETDHERPLNKRGRKDAPRVADELARLGWEPDFVASSDSRRTTETWELMSPQLKDPVEVVFQGQMYHASFRQIVDAVEATPDEISTVLVLGHNPGWEQSVFHFSGDSVIMTTANAALLEQECDSWAEAMQQRGTWKLISMIRPRELS